MLSRFTPGIVAGLLLISTAGGQTIDQYEVKAGFVTSFANFVEWPPEAFKSPHDPFVICVLGRNPFGATLAGLVAGKVVGNRALMLRELMDVREAEGCHILFISASEHLRFRAILSSLREQSIFSIGDTNDFVSEGGVANLRIENGRVRIEINVVAAKEKNLRISSRLMGLARIVK
jgi:hypothetical protein